MAKRDQILCTSPAVEVNGACSLSGWATIMEAVFRAVWLSAYMLDG